MKKNLILILSALLLLLLSATDVDAQYQRSSKKKKKKKPAKTEKEAESRDDTRRKGDSNLNDLLYYGVNVGNIGFGNSAFAVGLSPHVAYKFSEAFSAGFMLKVDYNYQRLNFGGGQKTNLNLLDLGPTAFTRFRIGEAFFLQAEYERASIQEGFLVGTDVVTERHGENFAYIGAGYGGGYPVGTYISIHYNILDDINAARIPWDYRIGITFNF